MKLNQDGETLRVSPSELKDADTCMRLYYYKHLKRCVIPKKYGPPFVLGLTLHRCLEAVFAGKTNEEAWEAGMLYWENLRKEAKELWFKTEDLDKITEIEFQKRAKVLFGQIANAFLGNEILGREERVGIQIDKYHTLHGYLDIRHRDTSKKMRIGDWKFGAKAKTAGDILEFWYQFVGYKFMVEHMFGESPDVFMHTGSVSMAGIPKQIATYNILPVSLPWDKMWREIVDRVHYLVEHVITATDTDDVKRRFPQTGRCNGRCSYCEFIPICSGIEPEEKYIQPDNKEIEIR